MATMGDHDFDPQARTAETMTTKTPITPKTASRSPLSLDDLPPPNTERWVTRRKALVVKAVRTGLITLDEACQRYTLSVEEFLSWQSLLDRHGLKGLRSTKTKDYRPPHDPVMA